MMKSMNCHCACGAIIIVRKWWKENHFFTDPMHASEHNLQNSQNSFLGPNKTDMLLKSLSKTELNKNSFLNFLYNWNTIFFIGLNYNVSNSYNLYVHGSVFNRKLLDSEQ